MRIGNNIFKELLLIFLVLFIFQPQSFAGGEEEYSIIEKNHKKGLVNKKGRVIIPVEYEDLGWTNGGTKLLENVIGFKKNGLWGILNTKNEKITKPVYTSLTRFNDNWIVASKKLLYNSNIVYGVINAKGKAEIAFQYEKLRVRNENLIATSIIDNKYVYGILNDKGKPVVPIIYDKIELAGKTLYGISKNDKIAVFNQDGEKLTDFVLDSIKTFDEDNILTFQNGKKGLIYEAGAYIIKPTYKDILITNGKIKAQKFREWQVFDNKNQLCATYAYDDIVPKGVELYKVRVGEAQALIHKSDSILTPFSNFDIQEHFGNWISVKQDGKYGVLHIDGSLFLEPLYDSVRFEKGIFIAKSKRAGKRGWSMINNSGEVITDQVYDEIGWLGDTYFMAKRDKYWGVVNSIGKEFIFCKYDSIVQYTEGKLLVDFLGEDGILNLDGSWEILPQKKDVEIVDPLRYLIRSPYGSYVAFYPDTKDFTAEYFLYKHGDRYLEKTLDSKFGLLDEEGVRVIQPEFDEISTLQDDSIYYAKSEKGYSFITKSGKIMIANDPRFQEIHDMDEEFIGVKIDGSWGFVDINGKLRVSNQYENVGQYNEGLAPIKILGRWGYINKREDLIVQPRYDTVYNFQGGVCEVSRKGKYGIIDSKGQITLDCEYDNLSRLNTGGFITVKDNKKGLVSNKGRLLILPKFDDMIDLDNGFVIASRNSKYGLMSNDGVDIIPMIYDNLKYDQYNDVYLTTKSSDWIDIKIP